MSFFSGRDKIAISVLIFLILSGWCLRFIITSSEIKQEDEVRVIRSAIKVPDAISNGDSADAAVLPAAVIAHENKNDNNSEFIETVNINTAEAEEFETLPMIGEVKAKAIVEYREKNGPFKKTEDLIKVNGIGKGTYEKIKPYLKVSD